MYNPRHWCQLETKTRCSAVRQGFKPLPQSESRLKTTEEWRTHESSSDDFRYKSGNWFPGGLSGGREDSVDWQLKLALKNTATSFIWDRDRPETGFLRELWVIAQKPIKTRFLRWRAIAQKPGFYENTSLSIATTQKSIALLFLIKPIILVE